MRPSISILLDVMLPGKNGFDVCREVRASGLDTPIIFLSALTQESDRISGLNLGANDYVVKPFSSSELMARVRGLLRYAECCRQDRRRFEHELEDARKVQERLVPLSPPAGRGARLRWNVLPGPRGQRRLLRLLRASFRMLCDAARRCLRQGNASGIAAASLHAAVRACASAADRDCGALLTSVNRLLFEATAEDRFATMFYAVYDPESRMLTWTNAGHCPPWWVRSPRTLIRLETLTPPVGLLPTIDAAERTERLAPGDRLVVVSDGITESRDRSGAEFGDRRVAQTVWRYRRALGRLISARRSSMRSVNSAAAARSTTIAPSSPRS